MREVVLEKLADVFQGDFTSDSLEASGYGCALFDVFILHCFIKKDQIFLDVEIGVVFLFWFLCVFGLACVFHFDVSFGVVHCLNYKA